jgi:ATP phosphoribosyltransferase regulatory subunit
MAGAELSSRDETALFDLIQKKSIAGLKLKSEELALPESLATKIAALPSLCGSSAVISDALELFTDSPEIEVRLKHLEELQAAIKRRFENIDIYFDLSELRGYAYHTGIVFAAYIEGETQCVAKGGRYDDVGEVFGRARAATGFDLDAKVLLGMVEPKRPESRRVLARDNAIGTDEKGRWQEISRLRNEGYIVLESLADGQEYDLELTRKSGKWQLVG